MGNTLIKCDRCGEELSKLETVNQLFISDAHPKNKGLIVDISIRKYKLCNKCKNEIEKQLINKHNSDYEVCNWRLSND